MRDIVQPDRSLTAFVGGARKALHGFRRIDDMAIAQLGSSKRTPRGFRFVSLQTATLVLIVAALSSDAVPVSAQPFGWMFGGVPARRLVRPRRRQPALTATVPLPVPRPHFASDPGPPAPPAPKQVGEPASRAAGVGVVPLPPEKPGDVAQPPAKPGPGDAPPTAASPGVASAPAPTAPQAPAVRPGPPSPAAPIPPTKPPDLRTPAPAVAPSGARLDETPGQPAEDVACPHRLKDRAVDAEAIDIGPQPDPRCSVVQPVRLLDLMLADGTKVSFPEKPRIACATADAFTAYVRDLLAPLAKGTYGSTVTTVWTGPGLECRSRDHIFGAKLSAHGQGLAVDVAQLKLADGRLFEVGQPKGPIDASFETAARAGACGYFHTVLGPGSDSYHRTHWHLDLEVRGAKGDTKYCH